LGSKAYSGTNRGENKKGMFEARSELQF